MMYCIPRSLYTTSPFVSMLYEVLQPHLVNVVIINIAIRPEPKAYIYSRKGKLESLNLNFLRLDDLYWSSDLGEPRPSSSSCCDIV